MLKLIMETYPGKIDYKLPDMTNYPPMCEIHEIILFCIVAQ